MRKNNLRRSTSSPLTQKIKAPQHLLRLRDEQDGSDNEWSDHFQLPSLPRQKSWKDNDNTPSNEHSTATSVSWSQETEDVATQKLDEQWAVVEGSLYEENDQLPQGSILDECVQWRTQIPYLRVIGRNLTCTDNCNVHNDPGSNSKKVKKLVKIKSDEKIFIDRSLSIKEKEDSAQYKLNKAKFEDILDILMEHIISELFPNKENNTDSLSLNDTLKISPAPVRGNKNSSKGSKTNWAEEAVSHNYLESKSLNIKNRLLDTENSFQTTKNDEDSQEIQKKQKNSIPTDKSREFGGMGDDNTSKSKETLCTPHIGRNKLGTVFNEKIIVSPVPFAVSTRESFCTLKTTPIRFMGFRDSTKRSSFSLRNSNVHSAWQAPVYPAVWPKNVRLAPIDVSSFPSNRNRSLAPSPSALHCNKKPLSPISRPTIPKSAHAICNHNDLLEIQGKHIIPAQSSKINLLSGWDYSPRVVKSRKKKVRAKERS